MHTASSVHELLATRVWAQRLARQLVGGAAEADDLVQDAFEVALRNPPPVDVPFGAWLVGILRRSGHSTRRSEVRRERWQHAGGAHLAAEAASAAASTEGLVEQLQTQRMLADLVLALRTPLRDVVLLRYYDGLSSVEISERLGLPDGTVRRRLKEAIDELRAALDLGAGRREAWLPAFGTLAAPIERAAPVKALSAASWLVKAAPWAAAAVIVSAAIIVLSRTRTERDARRDPTATAQAAAATRTSKEPTVNDSQLNAARASGMKTAAQALAVLAASTATNVSNASATADDSHEHRPVAHAAHAADESAGSGDRHGRRSQERASVSAEEQEFLNAAKERVHASLAEPLRAIYTEVTGEPPPHGDYARLIAELEKVAKDKGMLAAYERARGATRHRTSPPSSSAPAWERLWWIRAQEQPRLREELAKDISALRADELAHTSSAAHATRQHTHR